MVESRTGKDGELYDVVMYDIKAQQLYLDHLAKQDEPSESEQA
jgi:hypothetical protein